jgi:ABC-type dipeptide/oligopeptide/nickel transport system permease component
MMLKYLVHRLIGILPVLRLISVVVFAFVHLLPGDPARLVAGQDALLSAGRSFIGVADHLTFFRVWRSS